MNPKVNLKASEFSISEARRNFSSLVREAENGKVVRITRRGKPGAVLSGNREFERHASAPRDFAEAYENFLESYPVEDLDIDPDEVFRDSRNESAGRDVSL
ncbi:MAG: type II toxin-antitoxin system Phd/YefM family antitoxin [Acidobacteriia bacterium]|nr:type II toxin-antitoxin system Phd/YefM family antitoxin [Terriglobia bacterium]